MNLFKTLKKVYKTGYFSHFRLTKTYLSFCDSSNNMYVLQLDRTSRIGLYVFRIGHVEHWKQMKLTYESDYSVMGLVDCSAFIDHYKHVRTDNPDFILRASMNNLFNT